MPPKNKKIIRIIKPCFFSIGEGLD